ncbi:MAG: histidine phosphatase family protein [Pirellulales bacterium]|nr:histidine phosphatase family protein [Pirellulales bacterium]
MILRSPAVARVLLVRPGATEFDDQGRIKGCLDIPMSDRGREQAESLAEELSDIRVRTIYTSPCESARETAKRLAAGRDVRVKVIDALRNIDHGLWHGKLIDEVRRNHPKVYRQGQEAPDELCPPGGEAIRDAKARVLKAVRKIVRKRGDDMVAFVVPDPMAAVLQSVLSGEEIPDLWKAETDSGHWQLIESVIR